MPRQDRAKQFAPFDALKGLHEALKMKEYEHERVIKGDLSEEEILQLSKTITSLNKDDTVKVEYFFDGHYIALIGKAKAEIEMRRLVINKKIIDFDDIKSIEILNK